VDFFRCFSLSFSSLSNENLAHALTDNPIAGIPLASTHLFTVVAFPFYRVLTVFPLPFRSQNIAIFSLFGSRKIQNLTDHNSRKLMIKVLFIAFPFCLTFFKAFNVNFMLNQVL
jgi:hypothetical protein